MSPRPKLEHLRKPQIVAAAAEVLYERGLFETRIGDIAERAGTSSATILYYFESKDRLLEEAVEHADREWYERLSERLERCERRRARSSSALIEDTSRGQGAAGRLDAVARDLGARAARPGGARVLPAPRPPPARADRGDRARGPGRRRVRRRRRPRRRRARPLRADGRPGDPGHARAAGRQPAPHGRAAASRSPRSSWAASSAEPATPAARGEPARSRVRRRDSTAARCCAAARSPRRGSARAGLLGACADTTTPVGAIAARRRRRARRPAARAAQPRRSTLPIYPDNQRDRVGPAPRGGAAAVLQLDRLHQPGRHQRLPAQYKRQGRDQHVHDDRRGGREARERRRAVRRVRARDGVPRASSSSARSCSRSTTPTCRTCAAQRLAVAAEPVVRRRQPLLGAVHGLHDRDRLARGLPARLRPGQARASRGARCGREGPKIAGKVGLLDDEHDGTDDGAAPQRRHRPQHREPAAAQRRPRRARSTLVKTTNLKFDTNEYQHLADGSLWLHQAWSGDMASAPLLPPKGTPASVLRYWWPTDGRGPINNDMFGVLRGARNPVLAHLFLNHLLDPDEAFKNFTFICYQQPLNAMTPEVLDRARPRPAEPATRRSSARQQFKQRPRPGPAEPGRRGAVGERLGGGEVRRERGRGRR